MINRDRKLSIGIFGAAFTFYRVAIFVISSLPVKSTRQVESPNFTEHDWSLKSLCFPVLVLYFYTSYKV